MDEIPVLGNKICDFVRKTVKKKFGKGAGFRKHGAISFWFCDGKVQNKNKYEIEMIVD